MGYRDAGRYRPPPLAHQRLSRAVALLAAVGASPSRTVALEVRGRHSGRTRRTALVLAEYGGDSYLVSLGGESPWVRNVRAAGGRAVLRHGRARPVRLVEVPAERRAAVLLAYASRRSAARPPAFVAREYLGVRPNPSLEELGAVARRYPVFRIVPARPDGGQAAAGTRPGHRWRGGGDEPRTLGRHHGG